MPEMPEMPEIFGLKAKPGETPREMTKDESVDKLLNQLATLSHYWATLKPNPNSPLESDRVEKTPLERCNGLVFSILAMIDGSNIGLPAFDLVPVQPEDDKEFLIARGEHYWPTHAINDDTHLHDRWHKYEIED
jgi:hypothetical protein